MRISGAFAVCLSIAACADSAPTVIELPPLAGASAFVATRSAEIDRNYAIATTGSQTAIVMPPGSVQVLSFARPLAEIGLEEGVVSPSDSLVSAPLPPAVDAFTLDTELGDWIATTRLWGDVENFRLEPPGLCPDYGGLTEERLDIEGRLNDVVQRSDGRLLLVSSSTMGARAGWVNELTRGQPLVQLEADDAQRQVLKVVEGQLWIAGDGLWRAEDQPAWSTTQVASLADIEGSKIVSLAGPISVASVRYEIVALTRRGVFWGWTGTDLRRLDEGYGTTAEVAAIKYGEYLYFSRFFKAGATREDNFLIQVSSDGFEQLDVPRELTDSEDSVFSIASFAVLDDRLFFAGANLGELVAFDGDGMKAWTAPNDTGILGLLARDDHLFMSTRRRTLFQTRNINAVHLQCDPPVARFGNGGAANKAEIFATPDGIVLVGQRQPGDRYATHVLRLNKL